MNKLLIPVILSIIILLGFSTVYGAEHDEVIIPSWIKVVAGAWYNDEIDDNTFSEAMSFLIENNIIEIRNPIYMVEPEEPELVINLKEQIQTLYDKMDQVEKDKDDMETRILKDQAESEKWHKDEIEKFRLMFVESDAKRSDLDEENILLKKQLESLLKTVESLK